MKLFGILLLALSFGQCASVKMDQNPPFKVESSSYTHITGGLPGNNSLNLMIEFTASETIDFKKVYFQNRITQAVVEQKEGKQYIAARYKTSSGQDRKDLVLHADPKEEFGNTPNSPTEKFPFELKDDEAIISYTIGKEIRYVKIENIKERKKVFMQ